MNTQSKIVLPEALGAQANLVMIGGWFDPVTAGVARLVEEIIGKHEGCKLAAVVFDGAGSLLPAKARAVLMAALRAVALVTVLPEEQWPAFLEGRDKYDGPSSRDFIDTVIRKSAQAAGCGIEQKRNSADLAAPGESVVRGFSEAWA